MARKSGARWFVSGVNGENQPRRFLLDLSELAAGTGSLITDGAGGNLSFDQKTVNLPADKKLEVTLPPGGGFVLTLNP